MPNNRISLLIALEGDDSDLNRTLRDAENHLNELAGAARVAGEKASTGFAQVRAGLGALDDQLRSAKGQLLAFVGISWGLEKARQLVEVADQWNLLEARLKLATDSTADLTNAQTNLFAIAQRIGVPIAQATVLFTKLQQAVRMLGLSQQDTLTLTESISQALRLSGASTQEAESALLQFGQALASGVLRGEEFNSVVENSPRLAQALADGLNVPIGRLRKLAEEGQLTADTVVNALLSQKTKLETEYQQLPQTVGQAFVRLENAFGQWVHNVDASTGFSQRFAEVLSKVANNLDTVMQWLTKLAEIGLAVLIYRLIPAMITAWQTLSIAAVASAHATVAAWTAVQLPITAAIASVGLLKAGFAVLGAFLVGWEIGTWLSARFETVRKAGILMVEGLVRGFELLRFGWELFAALFTGDTVAAATARHEARLKTMNQTFAQMYKDAEQGTNAATTAMNAAGTTAESINRQLQAVRQGTQEAVGRGIEAVNHALSALNTQLGSVEQRLNQAEQTVTSTTAHMAAAYKGLTDLIADNLAQQSKAVTTRYQQERTALELTERAETLKITGATALLTKELADQSLKRQTATNDTLALITRESVARLEAAARIGKTEAERAANVQRVNAEIEVSQRQSLQVALSDYRQHIDALNSEANRHLTEIKRIDAEKRQLELSTEERIRELQRATLTEWEATQDRKREIGELQDQAREALARGELENAKNLAKQAMELATTVANSQAQESRRALDAQIADQQALTQITALETAARAANRRGDAAEAERLLQQAETARAELAARARATDQQVSDGKASVNQAIQAIRDSEMILAQSLEAEARAHQTAADSARSARAGMQTTLNETQAQVDKLTESLSKNYELSLSADLTPFNQALAEVDRALADKTRLLVIKADLEQAEKQLDDYALRLKNGLDLPVGADMSRAKNALTELKDFATSHLAVELRVATDKASASITTLENQLSALHRVSTEHQINTNAAAVSAQIQQLNNQNTHSTHTVYVQKVEAHAVGGVVGEGTPIARFSAGGFAFPTQRSGTVPGTGNQDTVPRTLEAGAFVVRKAAVEHYGSRTIAALANLSNVPRFAKGGLAFFRHFSSSVNTASDSITDSNTPKQNRAVAELLDRIDLGVKAVDLYTTWLERTQGFWLSPSMRDKSLRNIKDQAEDDRKVLNHLRDKPELNSEETMILHFMTPRWQNAMAQATLVGQDFEKALQTRLTEQSPSFFRDGGSTSDTLPALLTPGEFIINKSAVGRLGVPLLNALNNLSLPKKGLPGFASGGLIPSSLYTPSPSSSLSPQSNTIPPPTRTVRVELASGTQQVTAHIDARDESRLLDLLTQARSRTHGF